MGWELRCGVRGGWEGEVVEVVEGGGFVAEGEEEGGGELAVDW